MKLEVPIAVEAASLSFQDLHIYMNVLNDHASSTVMVVVVPAVQSHTETPQNLSLAC